MIAIPVLRSRIAPVLNWCTRVILSDPQQPDPIIREVLVWDPRDPFARLWELRARGVETLLCGAISRDLLLYGESLGLEVISGISGELEEVIRGYREGRLGEAAFRLPGCRGLGGYRRQRGPHVAALPGEAPCGNRRRDGGGPSYGAGHCLCPRCGAQVVHEAGIPCHLVACPECGAAMRRRHPGS